MFEALKALALRLAVVPPEPKAPSGSPGSIRVFRAAANYWKYLLVLWGVRHAVGAFVIVAWLSGMVPLELPAFVRWLEYLALAVFVIQMPLSLAATRLNYEMRWYIVTDRSLRIREGIIAVREMTLTFANVQNISIRQGPLQRAMGIADVVVRTAGGGSSDSHGGKTQGIGTSLHEGTLRAVDNAEQVRDLILDRLRRLRDSGLGDPDDRHHHAASAPTVLSAAASALLTEARALRIAAISALDPDRR